MGMREGAGVQARGHQTGEMRHVDQEVSPHGIGDFPHLRKVDDARDGRAAGDDHLRLVLGRQGLDLVVIQPQVLLAHAILHRMEPLARLVRRRAMGQVAAGVEAHAQDGVAGLQKRLEHALVGLRPGVRLHVGMSAGEQPAGPLDRQVFSDINVLAAAVIALAGIALGIFVGHHRALRLHHGGRDDVLAGDQLDLVTLPAQLLPHRPEKLGVARGKRFAEKAGVAVRGVHRVVLSFSRSSQGRRQCSSWFASGAPRSAPGVPTATGAEGRPAEG
jgi:hypothetical protein